jgi:tryptophan-rich sensory protein
MNSFTLPIVLCVAEVASEAALAGRNATAFMKSLKQPTWALPSRAWYFVGIAYYAGCFVSLYRLANSPPAKGRSSALALVIAVMSCNSAWNFIFFRRRDFALSFWFFLPYTILVLALVFNLSRVSVVGTAIFVVYLLYLLYALAWSYYTWKLNRV